ncbi:S-adenosyl-L-methionine-dependent methyltransferase [Ochromonadaceae sp. CCMP2298]|nr:S-adenosyl-L-methionine-dependent methyltransferase [Ochromonadaceae sp. CCMP2298]|mmetsp:Transcript_16416/g.36321  ORF Transcript_16416/g.36321 Transcript_16416/m.36321 type:complete len:281 (-) Transcript_16416:546-1388(-)|eukprot:CAMPEP_0173204618 /NCGR_PEP_ID=MMETSP1141-20130122/20233_1 /TAXON_ID=483371 /ORGANISM="non described non described, Strain CCMP2298" /LENGTH=280 /DNA_ID=CAMNT_0014130323 /DNA_START=71 /DNA_END=913 /DNA_ORIENTATION=+
MSRPEGSRPPELFYDDTEAKKYNSSSRMINIQREITNRAIEMLGLPTNRSSYILDVGCGSGLSGQALEEAGHYWMGCDISGSMLDVANQRDNELGDLMKSDMGQGLPFRPGSFDGVVSVSAIQWLCYSDSADQNPMARLNRFFSSLYAVLKKDARAVLQFYPETSEQAVVVATAASKVGFAGGIVVDYPNSSKAKKYYLCLSFERSYQVPTAMGTGTAAGGEGVQVVGRERSVVRRSCKPQRLAPKSAEWIKQKKDQHRKAGKEVKTDSKFSGRKRAPGF